MMLKVHGWVKSVQKAGKNVFAKIEGHLENPQELLQIVIPKELAKNVRVGCAISASGKEQKSQGAQQDIEVMVEQLKVVGADENPRYDISRDNLRKNVHLRARNPDFAELLRTRAAIFHQTHKFFKEHNYIHIDTPKLTRNDCEGGGEVFDVTSSSEEPMYLTVSSQLHLEAMISRLGRVYTLGPAFRAEKQQSHAHMSEFHMLEAETAFTDNVEDVCDFVEQYLRNISEFLENSHLKFPTDKFPRITYDEAVELLASRKKEKVTAKSGFSKKNELDLVEIHEHSPVFVTHYPVEQKPFYMARTEDQKRTLCFDLLVPGVGELAGGSVREHSAEKLAERGCQIDWYLELRRRGQPPSAGFGIGFDRLLQYSLGIQNIKDTVAFPRWHRHCQC